MTIEGKPSQGPTKDLREPLREILVRAGDVVMRYFRRPTIAVKSDGSLVTDADRVAEEIIVEGLVKAFPHDAVVSEEGARVSGANNTWFVDPIDGTSAFVEELAHFGPTVCLVRDGTLLAGGLWFPRLQEFWYAERGSGAWRDEVRLQPADPGAPTRISSLYLPSRTHRLAPIGWPGKVRALGSSAAHLSQVACGSGLAAMIVDWEVWDVGFGILAVTEAGRIVTTMSGQSQDPLAKPREPFLAGTPAAVHALTRKPTTG